MKLNYLNDVQLRWHNILQNKTLDGFAFGYDYFHIIGNKSYLFPTD